MDEEDSMELVSSFELMIILHINTPAGLLAAQSAAIKIKSRHFVTLLTFAKHLFKGLFHNDRIRHAGSQ